MSKAFKIWYGVPLENKEHALRGWNWGKADFGKAELAFNVQNRPAFEIPYSEISNTNLAGRNEVAVEFALQAEESANAQPAGSTKNRGRKAGVGRDELVEMRFYIPGTVVKKDEGEEGEEGEQKEKVKKEGEENEVEDEKDAEEEDVEEQNAANLFYETLMDKAEIGEVAGDTFATFLDVLHLTPRSESAVVDIKPKDDDESHANVYLFETEVGSISICTRVHSDFEAKHTTTKFNTNPLRNSFCCQRMTTPIH